MSRVSDALMKVDGERRWRNVRRWRRRGVVDKNQILVASALERCPRGGGGDLSNILHLIFVIVIVSFPGENKRWR